MKWYSDKFRRHLLDMHINDDRDEYMSEFSPENYLKMLKLGNIQVAMIYLQSHVGLCNWPTKSGRTHNFFQKKPDEIKRLIDMCRADGISVVGYYSLNFTQWAHDTHPQWRMLECNGKSSRENDKMERSGLCCPNNKGYREFVFRQIDEMLDFFRLDGIFFDMLYWPQTCYCDCCREKYKAEVGRELPDMENCSFSEKLSLNDAKARWMVEWATAVTEHVHKADPQLPVEHNFSAATNGFQHCCRDGIAEASEYVGGDLYGGTLEQAFVCATYRNLTPNQPFEYMTGRCTPNLMAHTVNKTEDELMQQVMITCAHHGAFLAIDAIDPVGTMDERVYKLIGKIYEEEAEYEPYLKGEVIEDVGLLFNLDSAVNLEGGDAGTKFLHFKTVDCECENRTASIGAAKHLIAEHIPYGVTTKKNFKEWDKYPVIVAPAINRLEPQVEDALIKYVRDGGCLYFSGCQQPKLFEVLIGGKIAKYSGTMKAYMYPVGEGKDLMPDYNEKYPIPFDMSIPFVEGISEGKILAYIKTAYTDRGDGATCASFHSDPPGIPTDYPAMVEKTYGKGKVIWAAGPVEFHKAPDYREIFAKMLRRLNDTPYTVTSTANPMVEIVSFKDGNSITLGTVNLADPAQLFTQPPFTVTVNCDAPVKSVKRLPTEEEISFEASGNSATFSVENLRILEMYKIETKGE